MFSKTNDLQQAIDQVNNGDTADVQSQLGVPPMPPTEGAGMPPMPAPFGDEAPAVPANDTPVDTMPEVKPAEESVAADVAPVASEAPVVDTPVAEAPIAPEVSSDDGDLSAVRENVLRDLIPLMDKVQGDAEYKFGIYREAMDTFHDKGLVSGAYKEASKITDEDKKAESLIELMKAIDTLK